MNKKAKVYLVYQEADGDEIGYWNTYYDLYDAVSSNSTDDEAGVEVYVATPSRLGMYKMKSKPVKVKE